MGLLQVKLIFGKRFFFLSVRPSGRAAGQISDSHSQDGVLRGIRHWGTYVAFSLSFKKCVGKDKCTRKDGGPWRGQANVASAFNKQLSKKKKE